jgi:hypothetical protein
MSKPSLLAAGHCWTYDFWIGVVGAAVVIAAIVATVLAVRAWLREDRWP